MDDCENLCPRGQLPLSGSKLDGLSALAPPNPLYAECTALRVKNVSRIVEICSQYAHCAGDTESSRTSTIQSIASLANYLSNLEKLSSELHDNAVRSLTSAEIELRQEQAELDAHHDRELRLLQKANADVRKATDELDAWGAEVSRLRAKLSVLESRIGPSPPAY